MTKTTDAAEVVAPFLLDLVPAIRWCFRDGPGRDGEQLVDVLWYAEVAGRFESRVSTVEVVASGRSWLVYGDLDEGSEILLMGDLSCDDQGRKTSYRIDPLDMAIERCRIALEAKREAA